MLVGMDVVLGAEVSGAEVAFVDTWGAEVRGASLTFVLGCVDSWVASGCGVGAAQESKKKRKRRCLIAPSYQSAEERCLKSGQGAKKVCAEIL
jgi:hypothetical protein